MTKFEGPHTRPPFARAVLAVGAAISGIATVVAVVALIVDPAVIAGSAAWMKPAKFALSITLFLLTMRWIVSHLPRHGRVLAVLSVALVGGLSAEIVLVDLQVLRGTTSHFNEATDFDALVFYAMGGIVSFVLIATIVVGALALRGGTMDAGLAAALRWGIAICVLGMLVAILMITNRDWSESGGHTVGALDGGPGMILTGWSTLHGDLRVGHFVGLHGLQALPLFAWALWRFTPLSVRTRKHLAHVAGAATVGVVALLTWQALRGQSLVQPDLATLAAGVILVALVAVATVIVVSASGDRGLDVPRGPAAQSVAPRR